ncbi:MAG: DMT family transporter, partial [Myxococcota bacterium]
ALSPFALAWIRVLCGALFFGVLFRVRGAPIPRRDVLRIAGCGLLGMAANQVLFLGGLAHTAAINASVLVTTIPLFTFVFAVLAGQERLRILTTLGIAFAFVGVLSLVGVEEASFGSTFLGDAMIVLNCMSYAAFLVLVRPLAQKHGSLAIVAIGFFTASLAVAPFGAPEIHTVSAATWTTWALVAYVVAIPTCAAYLINAWALRHATSSEVAIYIYLQPVVGVLLAVAVLDERTDLRGLVSIALVLVGISLVVWRPKEKSEDAAEPKLAKPQQEG